MPKARQMLGKIAAIMLLMVVLAIFLALTVLPAASRLSNGFLAYYVGGMVIKSGEPASRLYDEAWFSARVRQVSADRVTDIYLANPPILAVAWAPLAYLTPEHARKLWIALSALCLGVAVGLIATQLSGPPQLLGLAGLAALFTLPAPAREQFLLGQMYALLLLLHVIGWRAYARQQDVLAGAALGLALALKLSGWPIGLMMLARRRWTAVWSSIATATVAATATLHWIGFDAWRKFFVDAAPQALRRPSAALTVYQDTPGFWQHWLRFDARLNPHPILDAPLLASALTFVTAAIACIALIVCRRPAQLSFAAAVTLIELLSPAAEQYHYIVLLLPLAVLWHETWALRSKPGLLAASAATLLLALPVNFKAPHPAWAVLLSYPRLIGGWVIFASLLIRWHANDRAQSDQPATIAGDR
jgi:hypothetical protein